MSTREHPTIQRGTHLEHALGHVYFVVVQMARQALKVSQHLKARDAQSAGLDFGHRSFPSIRVTHQIAG